MFRQRVTQSDLADALGVSQATVSRKLHGTVAMTVDELAIIAGALGVDVVELLGGPAPRHVAAAAGAQPPAVPLPRLMRDAQLPAPPGLRRLAGGRR